MTPITAMTTARSQSMFHLLIPERPSGWGSGYPRSSSGPVVLRTRRRGSGPVGDVQQRVVQQHVGVDHRQHVGMAEQRGGPPDLDSSTARSSRSGRGPASQPARAGSPPTASIAPRARLARSSPFLKSSGRSKGLRSIWTSVPSRSPSGIRSRLGRPNRTGDRSSAAGRRSGRRARPSRPAAW